MINMHMDSFPCFCIIITTITTLSFRSVQEDFRRAVRFVLCSRGPLHRRPSVRDPLLLLHQSRSVFLLLLLFLFLGKDFLFVLLLRPLVLLSHSRLITEPCSTGSSFLSLTKLPARHPCSFAARHPLCLGNPPRRTEQSGRTGRGRSSRAAGLAQRTRWRSELNAFSSATYFARQIPLELTRFECGKP